MKIVELRTEEEFKQAYPIMQQLRPHLDRSAYLELLLRMQRIGGRMLALRGSSRIVALVTFGISTNLHYGQYIWVYDLIVHQEERGQGHGSRLLERVEEIAMSEGCQLVAFSSEIDCDDANRAYEESMDYKRTMFVFEKRMPN